VGTDASGDLVENDAPVDGSKYTRQNGGWSEITETGGDFITVNYSGAAAWAQINSVGTVTGSLNLTCSKTATGTYVFTFDNPMPNAGYSVVGTPRASGSRVVSITGQTATGFTAISQDNNFANTDGSLSVAVHALNALPPSKGTGADAWLFMEFDGNERSSFNLSGTSPSAGRYVYTFGTPMPTNDYAVVAQVAGDADRTRFLTVGNQTTTGFEVMCVDQDGVTRQNQRHSVVVHATTAALPNTLLKEDLLYSDGRQPVTGGIKFETSPVADPNTLDDYEEGVFTPSYGNATSTSHSVQNGRYTKVGNVVTCWIRLELNAFTASSSAWVHIQGLPFTQGSSDIDAATGFVAYAADFVNVPTGIYGSKGTNECFVRKGQAALNWGDMLAGTAKNELRACIQYRV